MTEAEFLRSKSVEKRIKVARTNENYVNPALDIAAGAIHSVPSDLYSIYHLAGDVLDATGASDLHIKSYEEQIRELGYGDTLPQTTAGMLTKELVGFLLVVGELSAVAKTRKAALLFSKIGAIRKYPKAAKLIGNVAAGAIASAVVMDPKQQRISDIIPSNWSNPLTDYLSHPDNPEETNMLKERLKNAVEGGVLDIFVMGMGAGAADLLNSTIMRTTKHAEFVKKLARTVGKDLDEKEAILRGITGLDVKLGEKNAPILALRLAGNKAKAGRSFSDKTISKIADIAGDADKKAAFKKSSKELLDAGDIKIAQEINEFPFDVTLKNGKNSGPDLATFKLNKLAKENIETADRLIRAEKVNPAIEAQIDAIVSKVDIKDENLAENLFVRFSESVTNGEVPEKLLDSPAYVVSFVDKAASKMAELLPASNKRVMRKTLYMNTTINRSNSILSSISKLSKEGLSDLETIKLIGRVDEALVVSSKINAPKSALGFPITNGLKSTVDGKTILLKDMTEKQFRSLPKLKRTVSEFLEKRPIKKEMLKLAENLKKKRSNAGSWGKLSSSEALEVELEKMTSGAGFSNTMDWLNEFRYTNMLSSTATYGRNVLGNAQYVFIEDLFENTLSRMNLATSVGESAFPVGVKYLKQRITSYTKATSEFWSDLKLLDKDHVIAKAAQGAREAGKSEAEISALTNSMADKKGWGVKGALKYLFEIGDATDVRIGKGIKEFEMGNTGKLMLDPEDNLLPFVKLPKKAANEVLRLGRAVSVNVNDLMDAYFKKLRFSADAYTMGLEEAADRGLEGQAKLFFGENMKDWSMAYLKNPTAAKAAIREQLTGQLAEGEIKTLIKHVSTISKVAFKQAKGAAFQNDLDSVSEGVMVALNNQNKIMQVFKTFAVPFFKTPLNLFKFVWTRTPVLRALHEETGKALAGKLGARAQAKAQAKLMTGTLLYSTAGFLSASKMMTGKHRPEERRAMLTAGIPEYSIYIPGTGRWVSYRGVEPISTFFSAVADLQNTLPYLSEGKAKQAAATFVMAIAGSPFKGTYFQGVNDVINAINGSKDAGIYFENQLKNSLPSPLPQGLMGTIQAASNKTVKERQYIKKDSQDTVIKEVAKYGGQLWLGVFYPGRENPIFGDRDIHTDAMGDAYSRENYPYRIFELGGIKTRQMKDEPISQEMLRLKYSPTNHPPALGPGVKMTKHEFNLVKDIKKNKFRIKDILNGLVMSDDYLELPDAIKKKAIQGVFRKLAKAGKGTLLKTDEGAMNRFIQAYKDEAKRGQIVHKYVPTKGHESLGRVNYLLGQKSLKNQTKGK